MTSRHIKRLITEAWSGACAVRGVRGGGGGGAPLPGANFCPPPAPVSLARPDPTLKNREGVR